MINWSTAADVIFLISDSPDVRRRLSSSSHDMPIYIPSRGIPPEEVFELISTLEPAVVIVDLSFDDERGSRMIRRLSARRSSPLVLAVSPERTDRTQGARQALIAGATGYLTRAELSDELERAVKRMTGGEIFLSEATKKTLNNPLYA